MTSNQLKYINRPIIARVSYGGFVAWDAERLFEEATYPLIYSFVEGEFSTDCGSVWTDISGPEDLVINQPDDLFNSDYGFTKGLANFNNWFNSIADLKRIGVWFFPRDQRYVLIRPPNVRFWFKFAEIHSDSPPTREPFYLAHGNDEIQYEVQDPRGWTDGGIIGGEFVYEGGSMESFFEAVEANDPW